MINTCRIMSASFMVTWVLNYSHREHANLKAAIVVGKLECLRIKEPKTRRAESGRVAGSVETGNNVMPANVWFPTGSAALITTLAAGAEAPAWLNSQGANISTSAFADTGSPVCDFVVTMPRCKRFDVAMFQASSMPCALCKPGPIQNHGQAFLRSATC